MINHQSVPIPYRMRSLPRDARGYLIPFVTMVDLTTGQPDFRVLDMRRQMQCIRDRKCGMCGRPLGKFIAFIGGPKSGETRVFNDPGMHRDCAEYAAKVCPFISRETSEHRDITPEQEAQLREAGVTIVTDERISPERTSSEMFIYIALDYTPVRGDVGVMSFSDPFVETIQVEQHRPAWGAH